MQFDPDRKSTGHVLIEGCTFWTGPLPGDAAGFKKGERPGENAVDTKTMPDGSRPTLLIRNCYFHGWNQPAQISNAAALRAGGQNRGGKFVTCWETASYKLAATVLSAGS